MAQLADITIGGRGYSFRSFTGEVIDAKKHLETRVSGSGGGYNNNTPVSISSHTITHDEIFLIDKEGKEKSFKLTELDVACRKGNRLTLVWASRSGSELGQYMFVYNHSTQSAFFNSWMLKDMHRSRVHLGWIWALCMGLLFLSWKFKGPEFISMLFLPVTLVLIGIAVLRAFTRPKQIDAFKKDLIARVKNLEHE